MLTNPALNDVNSSLRYRIFRKLHRHSDAFGLGFALGGNIAMNIHDKAPEFTLPDENGKEFSLKDLRGKTVILFFYPRANTPG